MEMAPGYILPKPLSLKPRCISKESVFIPSLALVLAEHTVSRWWNSTSIVGAPRVIEPQRSH